MGAWLSNRCSSAKTSAEEKNWKREGGKRKVSYLVEPLQVQGRCTLCTKDAKHLTRPSPGLGTLAKKVAQWGRC